MVLCVIVVSKVCIECEEVRGVGGGAKVKNKGVLSTGDDNVLKVVSSLKYLGVEFQRIGRWADVHEVV